MKQKNARGLSFASSGIGSLQHLVGESLGKALGVELLHVPYGGAASATASLMSNQVDLLFAGLAPIAPHLQSQKMHAVGIASAHRSRRFSDIPTFQEKGLQGVSFEYFVLAETFKAEVCQGFDRDAVCRVLLEHGCLVPDKGRSFDAKPRLPGMGLTRCYRIPPAIFGLDL